MFLVLKGPPISALVGAFSVIIQFQTSRRFIWSSTADPAFRFPVSLLEEPRVQHTLGYIATIVNHRAEFLLEEALLVAR